MRKQNTIVSIANLFSYKTIYDKDGNEYIVYATSLLREANCVLDKTEFEAVENHVHILNRINNKNFHDLCEAGKLLGRAMLAKLANDFPHKHFYVYISVEKGESLIARFHQNWEDEPPYYNLSDWENHSDIKIFGYHN